MICIECNKNVNLSEKYFLVAIERPYVNFYLHWDCWLSQKSNINENMSFYVQKWYNIIRGDNIKNDTRNTRKSRKTRRNQNK